LDYCGIAMLIMGSFVPWLYYGFYCHYQPKIIYLTVVTVLGFFSIVTSLWDKFSTPQLRPVRAGVFMAFGLSGVIPAIHYVCMEGWFNDISRASLGWLVLMGLLYILGAMFYALRIPERWFPGKFDLWVSSSKFPLQTPFEFHPTFRDNHIKFSTFSSSSPPSFTSTASTRWR
jgi:adiponectin receptor